MFASRETWKSAESRIARAVDIKRFLLNRVLRRREKKNLRLEGHAANRGSSTPAKVAASRAKASADRSNYQRWKYLPRITCRHS